MEYKQQSQTSHQITDYTEICKSRFVVKLWGFSYLNSRLIGLNPGWSIFVSIFPEIRKENRTM